MKINLLGDGAVGKTCLLKNYLGEVFDSSYYETIGATFSIKYEDLQLENETETRLFKLQIWDIAGQPRYTQVSEILYNKSDGAFIVFDLANRTSFQNCQSWIQAYLKDVGIGILCLVGNKSGLHLWLHNRVSEFPRNSPYHQYDEFELVCITSWTRTENWRTGHDSNKKLCKS